ncbi:hypothetical protein HK102_003101, partial [Quaeritorhiza haematococci]
MQMLPNAAKTPPSMAFYQPLTNYGSNSNPSSASSPAAASFPSSRTHVIVPHSNTLGGLGAASELNAASRPVYKDRWAAILFLLHLLALITTSILGFRSILIYSNNLSNPVVARVNSTFVWFDAIDKNVVGFWGEGGIQQTSVVVGGASDLAPSYGFGGMLSQGARGDGGITIAELEQDRDWELG